MAPLSSTLQKGTPMNSLSKVLALLSLLTTAIFINAQQNIPQVQHVIIVVQENRTPTNLFHEDQTSPLTANQQRGAAVAARVRIRWHNPTGAAKTAPSPSASSNQARTAPAGTRPAEGQPTPPTKRLGRELHSHFGRAHSFFLPARDDFA
jgi:hypothetical protein